MPGAFETKIHLPYQHRAFSLLFVARKGERDSNLFSPAAAGSDFTYELRDENQAEANAVVAVDGIGVVAIRGTAVARIAVPVPAAQHPVRTHDCCPFNLLQVECFKNNKNFQHRENRANRDYKAKELLSVALFRSVGQLFFNAAALQLIDRSL